MHIHALPRAPDRLATRRLVGDSLPMQTLRADIIRIARHPHPVLIRGESGTGKELVAHAIHLAGKRLAMPFVTMNCAAFPKDLITSELFGHERGAFTGACSKRPGLFAEAHEATIFLDEIGELPLDAQALLLRVLESGEVRPVGSSRARMVDVRVVAATHRDLDMMVRDGRFRADLFHRLNVLTIQVPSLRERLDDVPAIVSALMRAMKDEIEAREVSDESLNRLASYPWPGNVRQLRNVLVRASVLSDAYRIEAPHIVAAVAIEDMRLALAPRIEEETVRVHPVVTDDDVRRAITLSRGAIAPAARTLGIARSTLRARLHRLGLTPEIVS